MRAVSCSIMSNRSVFVAGASGVIGRRLCPLLVADGWRVTGTTRSVEKADALRRMGVSPVLVDVFDADALKRAVAGSQPEIVIHQLTDLPPGLEPARMAEGRERTARLRDIGTANLVAAAVDAGVTRFIAQSIAFAYAPGPQPFTENAPLDPAATGVIRLEEQVRDALFAGLVLRYGKFYGPGTGFDTPPSSGPLHVDAAADAARRAMTRGATGIYNIAEDDGTVSSEKAMRELGWNPAFRVD